MQSLLIKDGTGSIQYLAVESGSYGLIPIHQVTSSQQNPVYVQVTSSEQNPVYVQVTSSEQNPVYVQTKKSQYVTLTTASVSDWSTQASGTFTLLTESANRKSLMIFNPGPNDLYVAMSTAGGATNGFLINDVSQPPDFYSFILYPSGAFVGDNTNLNVHYGGYFVSASSNSIRVTSIV